jgi:hypothetical protein
MAQHYLATVLIARMRIQIAVYALQTRQGAIFALTRIISILVMNALTVRLFIRIATYVKIPMVHASVASLALE